MLLIPAYADITIQTVVGSGLPDCTETDCFTPATVIVDVGDIITMTNSDDTTIHTFTSGTVDGFTPSPDGVFDSAVLMSGESFEWISETEGEYPYYCTLHVWSQGMIVVEEQTMQVWVEDGVEIPGFGQTITIRVTGAQQTVSIEIIAPDGEIIERLSFPASSQGEINQPWIIPPETEPGTYTIIAQDAYNIAQTTFQHLVESEPPQFSLTLSQPHINTLNQQISKWNEFIIESQEDIDETTILLEQATSTNSTIQIEKYASQIDDLIALVEVYNTLIDTLTSQISIYS